MSTCSALSLQNNCTSIIEFLSLCGRLKSLKRQGWVENNIPNPESVASHMYRMAMCTFLIPNNLANRDKCMKMAIVHDLSESIVGDITPKCGVSAETKFNNEKKAMEKISKLVGEQVGNEMFDLWLEYEKGESIEAQFVKDIDKFDMVLQAHEYEQDLGVCLDAFFQSTDGQFKTELFKELDLYVRQKRKSD